MPPMAKVGIRDVARAANVSTATVSYVLNNSRTVSAETRQRVLDTAASLGYRPNINARSLQARRSYLIGYSWRPLPPRHNSPILDRFIHSIGLAAHRAGFHLLAAPTPSDQDELDVYRDLVATHRVDGIILSATNHDDPRVAFLGATDMPFVAFGRAGEGHDYPWVDVDGRAGLRLAVEHLAARGYEGIAMLAWPEGSESGSHRLAGYLDGLAAIGQPAREAWIVRVAHEAAAGYEGATRLLTLPPAERPAAIVCVSDLVAVGVLRAVREQGLRAGQDIGVVGFDDMPLTDFMRPSLTTVHQPVDEIGQLVVEQLTTLIAEGTLPSERRHILLEPTLVERESTERGP